MWKRVLQGLPAGQLSSLLRAGTDTLPTPLNLRRWRLKMDPRCPLCGNRQPTIHHILSNCSEALQQGRYTWRHDCALQVLAWGIKDHLDPDTVLYADLPGMRTSENPPATIPDNILITPAHPDNVMVAQSDVTLIELTIPHNSLESISRARQRNSEKEAYQLVLSDLEAKGLTSNLYTIEIGSLGHWLPSSRTALLKFATGLTKKDATKLMDTAACKVIKASQVIFRARTYSTWSSSRSCFDMYTLI